MTRESCFCVKIFASYIRGNPLWACAYKVDLCSVVDASSVKFERVADKGMNFSPSLLHIGYPGKIKVFFHAINLIWVPHCCRYSPFLMACYNPETEEYQSVCRVMSGFSDAFYIEVKMVEFLCAFFYHSNTLLTPKATHFFPKA